MRLITNALLVTKAWPSFYTCENTHTHRTPLPSFTSPTHPSTGIWVGDFCSKILIYIIQHIQLAINCNWPSNFSSVFSHFQFSQVLLLKDSISHHNFIMTTCVHRAGCSSTVPSYPSVCLLLPKFQEGWAYCMLHKRDQLSNWKQSQDFNSGFGLNLGLAFPTIPHTFQPPENSSDSRLIQQEEDEIQIAKQLGCSGKRTAF